MKDQECVSCRKPKGIHQCQVCENMVCKNCTMRVAEGAFSFLRVIPPGVSHSVYCGACFDENVLPVQEEYEEIMERAKGAFIFFKSQRKEVPLLGKSKETHRIESCPDRDETILRLAFFAAQEGYNAVIETEVISEKIRNGSYQTSNWKGSGVPARVNAEKIELQDLLKQRY